MKSSFMPTVRAAANPCNQSGSRKAFHSAREKDHAFDCETVTGPFEASGKSLKRMKFVWGVRPAHSLTLSNRCFPRFPRFSRAEMHRYFEVSRWVEIIGKALFGGGLSGISRRPSGAEEMVGDRFPRAAPAPRACTGLFSFGPSGTCAVVPGGTGADLKPALSSHAQIWRLTCVDIPAGREKQWRRGGWDALYPWGRTWLPSPPGKPVIRGRRVAAWRRLPPATSGAISWRGLRRSWAPRRSRLRWRGRCIRSRTARSTWALRGWRFFCPAFSF